MRCSRSRRCRPECLSRRSASTTRGMQRCSQRASSALPDGSRAAADGGRGRRYDAAVIARYSRPAMARIWSDEEKLARWLEVELAALDGWAEVGAVPEAAAREIRARAIVPSPDCVAELEAKLHHDTAAFVDAVAESLGEPGR